MCHVIDSHMHTTTALLISAQENTPFTALIIIRKLSSDSRSTPKCYHMKYIFGRPEREGKGTLKAMRKRYESETEREDGSNC